MKSIFIALMLTPFMAHAAITGELSEAAKSYNPSIEANVVRVDTRSSNCRIDSVEIMGQDPVLRIPRLVTVEMFNAVGSAVPPVAKPTVILLPPMGGVNILDSGFARKACRSDVNVVVISGWKHQDDVTFDYGMHNRGALRAVTAVRHTVEYLESKNFRSIGLLGTSIGAIGAALTIGFEPRIQSVALIVGSSRLREVVVESTEPITSRLREGRIAQMRLPRTTSLQAANLKYQQAVNSLVDAEPKNYLQNYGDRPALVIVADKDTMVPTKYQYELAALLGVKPLVLKGGHLEVIVKAFTFHGDELVSFFKSTLN